MPGPGGAGNGIKKAGIWGTLGSILGGPVGGLIGSLGSSLLTNSGAKKRQQTANRENVEFWNMQNAYNDPSAQMARLKEAGLNPNLIYGQSSGSAAGNAGAIAASKAAPYNIANPVPSAVQSMMAGPQKEQMRTQSLNNLANAAYSKSQKNRIDSLLPIEEARFKSEAAKAQSLAIQADIEATNLPKLIKDRISVSAQKVLQEKSITQLRKLEAQIARELKLRPNDPILFRYLTNIKNSATNWVDAQYNKISRTHYGGNELNYNNYQKK
jgi:hypothetical protein